MLASESANKQNHEGMNKRVFTDTLMLIPVVTQTWGLMVIKQGLTHTKSQALGPTLVHTHYWSLWRVPNVH